MKSIIPEQRRSEILSLMKREIIPAIGCTEPIAVALCCARAAEALGHRPEKIAAHLSANILKNAMGVGIPGTGRTGLPIAMALGATVGRSEYGLEVLRDVDDKAVADAAAMVDRREVCVDLKEGITEKLYIEIEVAARGQKAVAVISGDHTNFVYVAHGDRVLLDNRSSATSESAAEKPVELSMRTIWDFAMTTPLDELEFIDQARRLNMAASEVSFKGSYGHSLGRLLQNDAERLIMGDSLFTRILSYTSAACDARMAGAMVPVMSNSGSGNQGITSTIPVVVYAEHISATREQMLRALILSHLTVIYIKQSLGRLSALCGCVVASTGSSCGITYLMGGGYEQVAAAVKNMIANLTGMICDGAKPSCAMKLTSGVSTAVLSAMMAMDGRCVTSVEGIIDDDVDRSIANLTTIGRDAMNETDAMILKIMTSKC